jgi:hypothetical protein
MQKWSRIKRALLKYRNASVPVLEFSSPCSQKPDGYCPQTTEAISHNRNLYIWGIHFKAVIRSKDQTFMSSGFKWRFLTVHQLFIDFRKAYDSVRREVLYNILIKFGVPMKLVRLIKMCLNEKYSKVRIGKYLSNNFPIQNSLKQGDAL